MRIPKRYGQSREDRCFFCNLQATTENSQGIPTCITHKKETQDIKCACGEWLDSKKGKYGSFFLCMHCGPISMHKARELATPSQGGKEQKEHQEDVPEKEIREKRMPEKETTRNTERKKEVTIRSDDPLYFS
jgi:hypothetical protein